MVSNQELSDLFFSELKQYNSTNFKTALKADLDKAGDAVFKSFSAVVTRYFIFSEKHPEIPEADKRMLYFKLKIDMVAKYFSLYPDIHVDLLKPFQLEMRSYVEEKKQKLELEETA